MIDPENCGQLVCGGFQGTTVTLQAYDLVVKYRVSTMILLRKNAQLVDQMSRLIRDLQYIAYNTARYKYPLLFAVDMEGGMLNSLFDPENLSQFPGAMALAATGDTQIAYEISKALALQISHIGFLIILGPVLDVITKLSHQLVSVRSFGTTIEEVTKFGKAVARGLKDGGLLTVGKHFPGIGNASVDSLLELPMMTDSLEQIRRFNSVPFAELIHEGLLDGISAAGCGVPTISPDETHACLSPVLMTQLLRKEIGFQGFIISECLEMEALYDSIGLGQGVMLALCAGCDLVMVCHDFELQVEAIQSISTALYNGMIEEEVISASLTRMENLRKRLPQWDSIFPTGEPFEPILFKDAHPDLWQHHQELSRLAYKKSITLVRDYEGALPLSQYVGGNQDDNLLILTPLLNPIYPTHKHEKMQKSLYPGEAVFQSFGKKLSEHPSNVSGNVLHTTYTANGLTALHESLIEHSKAVVVVTSEASRNMYQIGIVKYISILCGATPSSLSRSQVASHLSKPLIIIATLSPYDFFYNKSIGSAYICCYDYTENVFNELVGVLMGDSIAQGCIPGEERFVVPKSRKRKSGFVGDKQLRKARRSTPPKRKWLVDEFDCNRDWRSLFKLLKTSETVFSDSSFRHILQLLHSTSDTQKHFVMRNSSLNIIYGAILTWVQDLGLPDHPDENKTGNIMYIFVDKSKRLQLIGKNLHSRAMRYFVEERGCRTINLGCLFPLLYTPEIGYENRILSFLQNSSWDIHDYSRLSLSNILVLKDLSNWTVPQKIFRELMIVGVRFDICLQTDKLHEMVNRVIEDTENSDKEKDTASSESDIDPVQSANINDAKHYRRWLRELYKVATDAKNSAFEAKVIIALEPTNQSVIGSVVLFTNRSDLSKFYPMIEEAGLGTSTYQKGALVGGIIGPVIDPSYSNLTEIFKFGLICSGVTYLKSNFCDESSQSGMNSCVMFGVTDDKLYSGIRDIGFEQWKPYHHYLDSQKDDEVVLRE